MTPEDEGWVSFSEDAPAGRLEFRGCPSCNGEGSGYKWEGRKVTGFWQCLDCKGYGIQMRQPVERTAQHGKRN